LKLGVVNVFVIGPDHLFVGRNCFEITAQRKIAIPKPKIAVRNQIWSFSFLDEFVEMATRLVVIAKLKEGLGKTVVKIVAFLNLLSSGKLLEFLEFRHSGFVLFHPVKSFSFPKDGPGF
jgi:hypothetical protein